MNKRQRKKWAKKNASPKLRVFLVAIRAFLRKESQESDFDRAWEAFRNYIR